MPVTNNGSAGSGQAHFPQATDRPRKQPSAGATARERIAAEKENLGHRNQTITILFFGRRTASWDRSVGYRTQLVVSIKST
jgi:hypothetical protein